MKGNQQIPAESIKNQSAGMKNLLGSSWPASPSTNSRCPCRRQLRSIEMPLFKSSNSGVMKARPRMLVRPLAVALIA